MDGAFLMISSIKNFYICAKYFPNRLLKPPIYCHPESIFKKHRTSNVNIKGRLQVGSYVSNLSEAPSIVRIRSGSTLNINGDVQLGRGVYLIVNNNSTVEIGDRTYVAADSKIYANEKISIGANCALSWNLTIIDTDFHEIFDTNNARNARPMTAPIHIGDNVWIGCNVTILKGVTIGDGAVIAAGSVVSKDIPPNCLAAGKPAKVIKSDIRWKL